MKQPLIELMHTSNVGFGTSGARGLVSDMTDRVCYAYTLGFLQYLERSQPCQSKCLVIAGDYRASTPNIMAVIMLAAKQYHYRVINAGFVPTPAVALYGLTHKMPAIMVTGSHIPDDRNGIKFNKPSGEILKPDEQAIQQEIIDLDETLFDATGTLLSAPIMPPQNEAIRQAYLERFSHFFAPDTLKGWHIGVYEHSSVSRDIIKDILQTLGATITALAPSKQFIPVDTEAIRSEDIQLALHWSHTHAFDAIVSTDGDGDRPLIADEQGRWLRGDIVGLLCARFLNTQHIVTPVSSNSAAELSQYFQQVKRTKIGSPFVIQAMNDLLDQGLSNISGYEANGGFLQADDITRQGQCLSALPTRDALIVILSVLALAKQQKSPVSQLLTDLPQRYTASHRLTPFPTHISQQMIQLFTSHDFTQNAAALAQALPHHQEKIIHIDTLDGIRITYQSGDIIHLRPSGNAPELRCYTESSNLEQAEKLNQSTLNQLATWKPA